MSDAWLDLLRLAVMGAVGLGGAWLGARATQRKEWWRHRRELYQPILISLMDLSAMLKERMGALIVGPSPTFFGQREQLVELAAKNRLPTVFRLAEYTRPGGLMSYGPHYADLFRRAATYVDKILKGVKPADLPVEQPTKFELVINLKTAKALGLTIPPSLLARADQVIE